MQYDEKTYLLPPGFGARHNPRLVFTTTATAWLAWALFLLAGSYTLFTSHQLALMLAWGLTAMVSAAAAAQFYVLRRRGAARIWRSGEHFDASVLSVRNDGGVGEVRVRFRDRDGVTRLMCLRMCSDDASRVSTEIPLRVALLDGELTYHYLPARAEDQSDMAM